MSYLTVHLISDLFLGFNEFSTSEESIPDVDLCVINGNIGYNKRSMLYAETLCKKYPETQFVYNNGEHELFIQANYPKSKNEFIYQMINRQLYSQNWPSNLHFSVDPMTITCRGQKQVDILCLYGYPFIHKVNCDWEETNWHQYYCKELLEVDKPEGQYLKPKETSNVDHGTIHIPADVNYINEMYSIENKKAKKFELMPTSNYKIYVTHFHPYQDTRLSNIDYSTYDIHIDKTSMWLSSNSNYNTLQFLGGKLYSNSGRGSNARNAIIYFN